jgi:nucleoid DNA-binding protein
MAKSAAKAPTKSEVFANIATATGLTKKQVAAVFEALGKEIGKSVGKKGPGVFQIPGLCKVIRKQIPAKPAQKNVLNRFTGQYGDVAAKPARTTVRVRPLKALKDMA